MSGGAGGTVTPTTGGDAAMAGEKAAFGYDPATLQEMKMNGGALTAYVDKNGWVPQWLMDPRFAQGLQTMHRTLQPPAAAAAAQQQAPMQMGGGQGGGPRVQPVVAEVMAAQRQRAAEERQKRAALGLELPRLGGLMDG